MTIRCSLAAALVCALFFIVRPNPAVAQARAKPSKVILAAPPYGNADSITQEELKIYDYFLASDQLEGRNFPSRGYDTAAIYVASHLAEWGLKPGGSTSGTNGPLQPYLMPIELAAKTVIPEESRASLVAPPPAGRGGRGPAGSGVAAELRTTNFEYGRDWTAGGAGGGGRGAAPSAFDVSGKLVFAGNGYVINKAKIDPYAGLDVHGKIIVVAGLPAALAALAAQQGAGGRGRGANAPNPLGEACTDFLTPEEYAAKNGALAVVTIANFQQLTAMANPNDAPGGGGRGAGLNGPTYQVVKFQREGPCPSAPSITSGLEITNALFQGEKLSASEIFYSVGSNSKKQESFELNSRKTLSLHLAVHSTAGHGENVVGIIEGSDPVLKDEYVLMSAHLDHIGLSAPLPDGHNVNNGADDDGSGSSALLAIARELAEGVAKGMRPRRTVILLWNGGEEKGLLGSQYFAEFPPVDLTKVVADLNADMIGRTKNPNSVDPDRTHILTDPGETLLIGPNVSSGDLEQLIDTVNNNYQKLKLNHFYDVTAPDATHDNLGPQPNGQRPFYRSDHYNFAKMGIPVAFFTNGLHLDYHRPTDTPEKIDFEHIQRVAKTMAAISWRLANQNGRPKLNATLPDQLVKDMKTVEAQGWGKVTPILPPLPGEPY